MKDKTAYSIIAIVAIATIGSVFYSYEYHAEQSKHEFDKGFFNDVGDNTVSSATWFSMVEIFQKKYVTTGGGIIDRVDGARTEIVASNQYGDSITLALEENRDGAYAEIICNHKILGKTERITENIVDYLQNKNCLIPILKETADQNAVVPRGDLFLQQPLRIEGLTQTYNIGQKIEFTVKFNGTGYDCGYPDLKIEDSEHQKIWQSGNTIHSCDPEMKEEHIEKEWQIENTPLGIPMINKTGFYTLFAEFDNYIIQHDFWIKSNSDTKIVGLKDTYKVGDNVRFYVTVQGVGMIPCEDFTISVKNDRGQTVLYIPTYNSSCQIPVKSENYKFVYPQKNESYQLRVNETGTYTISANFGDNSLEKEFVVKDNTKIKYHTGYSNLIQE